MESYFSTDFGKIYPGFIFLPRIFSYFPWFDQNWVNLDFVITVVLRDHIFIFSKIKNHDSVGKHKHLLWFTGK